ncbi:MAG: hypothetical protein DRJ01_10325 [Bacteroidetes bacterium]|nr:MAG: hypothetical protein DRJ01_10325 [Bacteroidota bacterium]
MAKEDVKDPIVDNEVDDTITLEKIKEMEEKLNKLTAENQRYKETIDTFDETLAKELDKITKKDDEVDDKDKEKGDKVDVTSIYDNVITKRKLEQEKAKEKEEIERIKKENQKLKFESGISKIIKDEPYLKEYIEASMEVGKFNTLEDVIRDIDNPALKQSLKYTYNRKKAFEEAGGDPLKMLEQDELANDSQQLLKDKKREENLKRWSKLLNRRR